MQFASLSDTALEDLRNALGRGHPRVAIDMGFSTKKSSTGMYWTGAANPVRHVFGLVCTRLIQLLGGVFGGQEPLLILEAPLTGAYKTTGTPKARDAFEAGRLWNSQAGATTGLGAQRLLEVVAESFQGDGRTLQVVEAFAPTSTLKDQGKLPLAAKDGEVAEYLYNNWTAVPIRYSAVWVAVSSLLPAPTAILDYT